MKSCKCRAGPQMPKLSEATESWRFSITRSVCMLQDLHDLRML